MEPTDYTLTHFILKEEKHHPDATGELSILLHAIEIASKYISSKVRCAGLFNLFGAQGVQNVQGENQLKLDVICNDAMIMSLKRSTTVSVMVSEEDEHPILIEENKNAKYCCAFDPLDGSSNVEANVSIGTIFGVYKKENPKSPASVSDILQPGNKLVAAGYTMYGSATILVLTTGQGVNGFTLDPSSGEFVLTHPDIRTKRWHSIYSCNEGNQRTWGEGVKRFVEKCKNGPKPFSARYVGSMVADVHRTILYGGIFMYPADKKTKNGKLRLLYEANPMAMILEQAGGKATNGDIRILDIVPTDHHMRCAVYMGSADLVDELMASIKEHGHFD
mmetsp:Transcript_27913/g.70003  ORF Transcript_27913/g.70003 Transcript_27913/m.70003 type:complete len:333 (+) Transcript_27913:71-1069(+)|eukprot:CAMPEP_0177649630 /NCGR_PEP_ID=MMETSP0447-20121125/11497_1 /TAXON_ID=0 /ORGANISM="Stygamoeba regulata, Strain BSH-02190019" /LENGTH=332 /DNA_ID=CAMNT_0019152417 /DNA_START=187 /DNA_END=1185 /DNA_ORIENTATION=+